MDNERERERECLFDILYFSENMDEVINGLRVGDARFNAGVRLSQMFEIDGDGVLGIPNTALKIAEGYSFDNGVKLTTCVQKNPLHGRSYHLPTHQERLDEVKSKFLYDNDQIEGKNLVVIDEAIFRGTTSKEVIEQLKQRGAKKIHFMATIPLLRSKCDNNKILIESELLSHRTNDVQSFIGADSFYFLPLDVAREVYSTNGMGCGKCIESI